jgi:hypothetical protein
MVADPKVSRPAIAMIELIFAIVVMGIVMLSAPTLISVSAKSTTVALQQEGINEAAARINMILTFDWDDNNIKHCYGSASILGTTNGDDELNARNTADTNHRIGVSADTKPVSTHTFNCGGEEYSATAIGREAGILDDIDDFDGNSALKVISGLGAGDGTGVDYIEQETVRIATAVQYGKDDATYSNKIIQDFSPFSAGSGGTTNIKTISTTLTSTNTAQELQKSITLQAFSCNLGSYQFYRRPMP